MQPHISVLSSEVLHFFAGQTLRYFIDGTLGAGGHAEALLKEHPEIEKLIGIDQDPSALRIAAVRLNEWKEKLSLQPGNFSDFNLETCGLKAGAIDGLLCDLGVSSMQLDIPERGFSFSKEGPLDMRMNPNEKLTAAEIVNEWSEKELGRIFKDYGEEKKWRAAAKAIVEARKKSRIETTSDLVSILQPLFPWKKKGINPMTLLFQGLRIAVNRELEVLEIFLRKAIDWMAPGGRLAIISFHSLEDRVVKNAFRYAASDKEDTVGLCGLFIAKEPKVKILTKKPVIPSDEEMKRNPRSRSAKLRVIQKL